MTPGQTAESRIKLQAYRDLAQARLDRMFLRGALLAALAVIGFSMVPILWWGLCLSLICASEWVEHHIARSLVSTLDDPASEMADGVERPFAVVHVLSTALITLSLAVVWIFSSSETQIYPLSFMVIVTMTNVALNQQVHGLLIARQALYGGIAVAMTAYHGTLGDGVFSHTGILWLLPVALFAAFALLLSHLSSNLYRERLEHDGQLGAALTTAEAADASKSDFIAMVSHELRTPLNGILGMTQTLLTTEVDAGQRRQIEVILESGQTLNALLTDILDYSKLEAGKLAINPTSEDLHASVEQIGRLYGPLAGQKGLEFSIVLPPNPPVRLLFDPIRVRQCLSNLVSNAIKFTETGSVRIAIACSPAATAADGAAQQLVTMVVTDTGIGIPPDQHAHLFQPFSQADLTISHRFGGTGLGLSITRQLIESMGGEISFTSIPGAGSEFRMSFLAGCVAEGDKLIGLANRRVLVADDIESNRMVMRLFLQPLGLTVIEAIDGAAALDALRGGNFDAALLDLNMPGMSGSKIATLVRGDATFDQGIALLAVTADSSGSGFELGSSGFDGIVSKPIDPSLLQRQLIDALSRRARTGPPE